MIAKIKDYIQVNRGILDSVMKLATGSILAQIIMILASPISTRLFTAQELGIYTLVLTAVSMFGPILSLRYDLAIVLAENKEETNAIVKLSLLISIIMTIIIGVGYIGYLSNNIEVKKEMGIFIYLLIPILFINGFTNIAMSYNNKNKRYGLMGSVQVIRAIGQNGIMIILGVLNTGSIGLLCSQLIGSGFGVKRESKDLLKEIRDIIKVDKSAVKNVMIKYNKQFYFSTPAIFVNAASYSLINFMISSLYGMDVFGYYSLSYRMLGLPIGLVVMNVSKVFFQQAAYEKQQEGKYRNILMKMMSMLIPIAIIMAIGIYILGPMAFEIVFGKGWGIAGEYAKILVPMFAIRLVASTLTPAFTISNKQNIELMLQSIFIVVLLGVYILAKIYTVNVEVFLNMINLTYACIYGIFLIYIFKLSKGEKEI